MTGQSAIHLEVLSKGQKKVLFNLATALADTDFYLAGGTALALQIGHRTSLDFDWFTDKLGDPEILLHRIKSADIMFELTLIDIETVYININDISVSFLGYSYPSLQPKVFLSEYRLRMASPDDIACMKLSAIASRGSRKDFVDIYYLIKHFRPLGDYLRLYRDKFETRDIGHVVRSLVYFETAESEPDIRMLEPLSWQSLKTDMEKWVKDFVRIEDSRAKK